MKTIALGIEYNGSNYCGWQKQLHSPSVQENLEQILSQIADSPINVFCAGRTDTGVHATGQVVHFQSVKDRPDRAWLLGTNTKLPDDIAVRWVKSVSDDFHARFSATARRYRYIIVNSDARPAINNAGLTWVRQPLDVTKMNQACEYFIGEKDFSAFQASSCQSPTSRRNIHHMYVERQGDYLIIDIKANAFLHHMVRNIAGTLIQIGRGIKPVIWTEELLISQNRNLAAATASAKGLYLVNVEYPESFEIPKMPIGPLFLPN